MAVKRISADTLLELALASLRDEIAPGLAADQRYTVAMIANAIAIARREISNDTEAPLWALLDEIYEPGEGSTRQLAADIRAGSVGDAKHPRLARMLLAHLEAELAVANPRFLQRDG